MSLISVISPVPWVLKWSSTSALVAASTRSSQLHQKSKPKPAPSSQLRIQQIHDHAKEHGAQQARGGSRYQEPVLKVKRKRQTRPRPRATSLDGLRSGRTITWKVPLRDIRLYRVASGHGQIPDTSACSRHDRSRWAHRPSSWVMVVGRASHPFPVEAPPA